MSDKLDPLTQRFLQQAFMQMPHKFLQLYFTLVGHRQRSIVASTVGGTDESKAALLISGPAGLGRYHCLQAMAQQFNIPIVCYRAHSDSRPESIKFELTQLVSQLYRVAGYDLAKAESGIVVIDDLENICSAHRLEPGQSCRAGQLILGDYVVGTEVQFNSQYVAGHYVGAEHKIRTGGMLFVGMTHKPVEKLMELMEPELLNLFTEHIFWTGVD